jgi:hypothetical protein
MKWLALFACLVLSTSTTARIDTPTNESDPDLVNLYLGFTCEALDLSYQFQYEEMIHIAERLHSCHEAADASPDFKYGRLLCMYVQIQWEVMNTHSKSVERAWEIMCDEDGQQKNPEYRI